jgi:hypothetical protein
MECATGEDQGTVTQGVLAEIDRDTGRALSIRRINTD